MVRHATALAGVMGGKGSEVTETTTDILLEVAYFNPRDVRKVRKALGISTDASYRFERGVDGGATAEIAELAARLIVSVAGGAIESMIDVGECASGAGVGAPAPQARRCNCSVCMSRKKILSACSRRLDLSLSPAAIVRTRSRRQRGVMICCTKSISWKRSRGFAEYDELPDELRPYRLGTVPDHPLYTAARRVRDALVAAGLAETRPMPFTKGAPDKNLPAGHESARGG